MAATATFLPSLADITSPPFLNASTEAPPSPNSTFVVFQNLIPAIVQCVTIIFLGYVAGRTGIVAPSQAKGLGSYVTYFALPAMIFKSLVTIAFNQVNWLFLASVLIAKAIVFTVVYVSTFFLCGTESLGKAGMYSMFATQSNDFAFGYPIIKALYGSSNPELVQVLFILAPINLIFLNPWAFLSLEVQKMSRTEGRRSKALVVWSVIKGLLTNPVFTVVIIGVIFNFALSQHIPSTFDEILTSLGNSFGATALFILGINMVGKVKQQSGMALTAPALLIASKLIVLPLVTNQLVYALDPGGSNTTLTETYASYGFLYGSLPTAPTVFFYATIYQQSVDMIAPTMVYCTIIAAPFMFVTATMMMIPMATEGQYHSALEQGAFAVGCVGLASAIWVFLIFLLRRKTSHLPHQFTANLIVAQALAALGVILCQSMDMTNYASKLIHFIIVLTGVYAARCWTAMVALSLFILRYRSTCFVIRHRFWFYLFGWGAPLITVGILVTVVPLQDHVDALFEVETQQLVASVVILLLNLCVTMAALIALHRLDRFRRGYQPIIGYDSEESQEETKSTVSLIKDINAKGGNTGTTPPLCNDSPSTSSSSSPTSQLTDIEDLPTLNDAIRRQMCRVQFGCSRRQARECKKLLLQRNLKEISKKEEEDDVFFDESKKHQLGRHIILLYLLVLSMIVGVSLCLWKLLGSTQSGIFLELSFLDTILNYGQGFIVLAIFGFDTENVIMPVIRLMRKCIYGTEKIRLPRRDELSPEVMQTCEQFRTHHLARCSDVIITDLKYHLRTYKKVFRGSDLVDWLLEVGLAEGRTEATNYATRLLIGRTLEHTHQEHHFHDNGYFYRFLVDEEEGGGGRRHSEEINGNDRLIEEDSRTITT